MMGFEARQRARVTSDAKTGKKLQPLKGRLRLAVLAASWLPLVPQQSPERFAKKQVAAVM